MMPAAFMRKVLITESCWLWTGARNGRGYGHFYYGGRMVKSHRLSFTLLRSQVPDELVIDHLCQNKACVNPDHLEPVTQQLNVVPAYEHKRNKH
jgi:hypothetical protein